MASPPDPRIVTPAYYYNLVEFVSIALNAFYYPKHTEQNSTAENDVLLLLPTFCTYFHFKYL